MFHFCLKSLTKVSNLICWQIHHLPQRIVLPKILYWVFQQNVSFTNIFFFFWRTKLFKNPSAFLINLNQKTPKLKSPVLIWASKTMGNMFSWNDFCKHFYVQHVKLVLISMNSEPIFSPSQRSFITSLLNNLGYINMIHIPQIKVFSMFPKITK